MEKLGISRFWRNRDWRLSMESRTKPNPCGISQAVELSSEERKQMERNQAAVKKHFESQGIIFEHK